MTQSAQFDTFTMERTFTAPLARVFQAFSDPREKKRWFAEGAEHEIEQYDMQFEVGGRELARYRFKPGTPFAGVALESNGYILDIVPRQRIVAVHRLMGEDQAMYGDGADGPELRRMGWQVLLDQLHAALGAK